MNVYIMFIYFYSIDISKGSDVDKTSESKECNIYHFWYFLDTRFKFQSDACNGCHDVLVLPMNLSIIAILNIHGTDHYNFISKISNSEAINLMKNIDLTDKKQIILKTIITYKNWYRNFNIWIY